MRSPVYVFGRIAVLAAIFCGANLGAQVTAPVPVTLFSGTYTRSSGPPITASSSFVVPASLGAPYLVSIQNGNSDGSNRVSAASIVLNGVEIAGPSAFSQNVAVLSIPVTLATNNTLEVTLKSKPQSLVSLAITGTASPDSVVTSNSASLSTSPTVIPLPTIGAKIRIPPSQVTTGSGVFSIVNSPLTLSLAALDDSFTLTTVPTLQVELSVQPAGDVGLMISSPDIVTLLNSGKPFTFLLPASTGSLDEPQGWALIPIGGTRCGNNDSVCVFLDPTSFVQSISDGPWVVDVTLATKSSIPDPLPATAIWKVSNVNPANNSPLQLASTSTLTVSADFELTTSLTFANVLVPFLPRPSCDTRQDIGYSCVNSPFGYRTNPKTGLLEFHDGVDLSTEIETASGAVPKSGFLVESATAGSANLAHGPVAGFRVEEDNSNFLSSVYKHLESGLGTFPRQVYTGEPIALSDNSGNLTTNPHLHFGAAINGQPIDPLPLLLNNLSLYVPYQLCISIDSAMIGCTDQNLPTTSVSIQAPPAVLVDYADGQTHTLSLQLQSLRLGRLQDLVDWQFQVGQAPVLTVSISPNGAGSVVSAPAGISCSSSCSASFQAPLITLTASPASGYVFAGWSGACSGTNASTTVTLTSAATCVATFSPGHTLTLHGCTGATIVSVPPKITCPISLLTSGGCSATFPVGSIVTLNTVPPTVETWTNQLGGSAVGSSVGVLMDQDKIVFAQEPNFSCL